jgi:hypothetical protein
MNQVVRGRREMTKRIETNVFSIESWKVELGPYIMEYKYWFLSLESMEWLIADMKVQSKYFQMNECKKGN